tara:strand:- start:212 stop:394 length:183 start_codon:yes stop_codon:yes gene_type:complete
MSLATSTRDISILRKDLQVDGGLSAIAWHGNDLAGIREGACSSLAAAFNRGLRGAPTRVH